MPDVVACTAVHPLADGEVRLLGAIECVTGAMTRVDIGGKRLLVDCGIGQGREASRWEFPDEARGVDAVLLTHGHLDHIGSLPHLLDGGFDKPILATTATLDIARISLEDSLTMQRASFREIKWFLETFDKLAHPLAYDRSGGPAGALNLNITFREAGHILGSASVDIVSDKSRVILSGDLGRPGSPILKDAFTAWPNVRPVDVVVMESTYGSRDHEHGHDDIAEKLLSVVTETSAKKGKIFIPAFAIGRTQVLLYFLNELVESGRLKRVPVALDTPMGLLVTETYAKFKKLYDAETIHKMSRGDDPLDFDDLYVSKKGGDSARLRNAPGPMIIIAGSGMVTGGRIINHLVQGGLSDERNTLLFVGHQSVGTPGRRIQEAAKTGASVWLDGEEVMVRARIETLRGLSAHADRGELKAWLGHIPNVKRVALHHGEATAQHDLVAYLEGKPLPPSSSSPAPTHKH
ncbi:MAG: MBL fold metallo-hydrolase [Deltaproteobacteria bacterium]|nr:MBL fold metallo-hydrolase [Deltaproteobacteria bacterium]